MSLPNGLYQIAFTQEQLLTAIELRPGAPLVILPPDGDLAQTWQVSSNGNGGHTISLPGTPSQVSYDGEPDMHELAILEPAPREWTLLPGAERDTYFISVPNAPMRLGMSLLRIYPPRVALAPEYGDPYQAWTFRNVS
ncbi:hypothetical protein [Streptomyces sp. NPDC002088]|uniref:hypothetical protein n=1 Tax=Streptomyces sp. NPDC002088 TaxID=3154665 RepID=UPI0033273FEA